MPSLIEQLAIRLNPQAGKSLVIPRKREFSPKLFRAAEQNQDVVPLCGDNLIIWIPVSMGMTG